MSLRLTFKIQLLSDYHVGSGHGQGTETDSALLRDADGIPVLRGTVVVGVLRDALWRLLQLGPLREQRTCQASGNVGADTAYCGQHVEGKEKEPCPICRVFGTPLSGKHWRISSARPESHPTLEMVPYAPDETGSQRIVRVRVSPRTRRSAPRQLFSEEQGASQSYLFTAECSMEDAAALDEAALLVAAARFVRQLGRSRRRGEGECLISLVSATWGSDGQKQVPDLLERFETVWLRKETGTKPEEARRRLKPVANPGPMTSHTIRFRVLARLDEPVVVASRASAGNRFDSQAAISGRTLRGALASQAARDFDLQDHATYAQFRHAFLNDAVRFPTLYPLSQRTYPVVPFPRDAGTCKVYQDHEIQWGTQGHGEKCPVCGKPLKLIRGKYAALRGPKAEEHRLRKRSEMHIEVDPATGRVAQGQLYDYVALEAGQYFAGELICADESAWRTLCDLTGLDEKQVFEVQLGKATHRGYGRASLWVTREESDSVPLWVQQPLRDRVKEGDTEVILTLLTDTIVTDPWGRFACSFDEAWLTRALGLPVSVVDDQSYAAVRLVDGFNAQWRLPAWRTVVLEAGSTARLRLASAVDAKTQEQLVEVEREGIGIQRNEGHGLVAFNHPIYRGCKGLSDTAITIERELDLALTPNAEARQEDRQKWADELDRMLIQTISSWRGQPFAALARWLYIQRYEDITTVLGGLQGLGNPQKPLIDRINRQGQRNGEKEFDYRESANDLQAGEDKEALASVAQLLGYLRQELPGAFWPEGIRILADRIAEAADRKEG